jgi:hypothetical protein
MSSGRCKALNFSKAMFGVTERIWMSTSPFEEATILEIRPLAASGASMDDVADKIQKKTRLNPDLIKYVAKTKTTA